MEILLDMHTHTYASGHAYSTIKEVAAAAAAQGLSAVGITEHAPTMPGTCHEFYFHNLKVLPRMMEGIQVLFGAELNIIDYDGSVDLPEETIKRLDITVASMHPPCLKFGTEAQNTNAVIKAMENPYVDIIGHPDDGRYPLNYEKIVKAAKETHTLIEINNASLNPSGFRVNTRENDLKILELCKLYEVPVILDSDAHFADDVGRLQYAAEVVREAQFPKQLIANARPKLFWSCLNMKKNRSGFLQNMLDTLEG